MLYELIQKIETNKYSTDITIKDSSSKEIWKVIYKRINEKLQYDLLKAQIL